MIDKIIVMYKDKKKTPDVIRKGMVGYQVGKEFKLRFLDVSVQERRNIIAALINAFERYDKEFEVNEGEQNKQSDK